MNKNSADDAIPSLNQLQDCSQILAFSVAQHREKGEQIPLINALPLVKKNVSANKNKPVYNAGKDIFEEALALAKSGSAPSTTRLDELRTQPRINVSTSANIKVPATGVEWQGNIDNISWGGLRVHTRDFLGVEDEVVELSLPYPDDGEIHIQATIVRSWEREGIHGTAVRFSQLSQKSESKLNQLLKLLLDNDDDKARKDTRFYQRIDVSYWDAEELKATLEDISKGGMMITMPDPVELNKSIKVQLDGTDDAYNLCLRARVIRQEAIIISEIEMYQIALEFEHPTEELRSMVHGLIEAMVNKGKTPTQF